MILDRDAVIAIIKFRVAARTLRRIFYKNHSRVFRHEGLWFRVAKGENKTIEVIYGKPDASRRCLLEIHELVLMAYSTRQIV